MRGFLPPRDLWFPGLCLCLEVRARTEGPGVGYWIQQITTTTENDI